MRIAFLTLLALLSPGRFLLGQTPERLAEARHLLSELQEEKTTAQAAAKLAEMAKADPDVQQLVSEQLPNVIEKYAVGPIGFNAVCLAGNLRLASAIPALVAALGRGRLSIGVLTFGGERRLDDDPAAKSLAEIGEPAVPAVAQALESTRKDVRWRATLVLINVNSAQARQTLRQHLDNEPDADLRTVIQREIH